MNERMKDVFVCSFSVGMDRIVMDFRSDGIDVNMCTNDWWHYAWFAVSYLRAGADFVATATYQASIMGFMKHLSISSSEAEQLLRKAVSVCLEARDNFWQDSTNRAGPALSFV